MHTATIAFFAALCVAQATAHPFDPLFSLDCDGKLAVLPNIAPISIVMDLHVAKITSDLIYNSMKTEVKKKCVNMTDEQFEYSFTWTPSFLLNQIKGPSRNIINQTASCNLSDVNTEVWMGLEGGVFGDLAILFENAKCDYESWAAGKPCHIEVNLLPWDVVGVAKMTKCANSFFPSFALAIKGNSQDIVGKLCQQNSHCGTNLKCNKVVDIKLQDIYNFSKTVKLYDEDDVSPGCSPVNGMLLSAMNYVNKQIYGATTADLTTSSQLSLCAANLTYIEDGESMEEIMERIGLVPPMNSTDDAIVLPFILNSSIPISAANIPSHPTPTSMTSGAFLMASVSCEGWVDFMPASELGFAMHTGAPVSLEWIYNWVFPSQKCRSTLRGKPVMTDLQFQSLWPWIPQWVFYQGQDPAPAAVVGENMSHLTLEYDGRVTMPSTCTYERWRDEGECTVQYKGLNSLLLTDMKINMKANKCPQSHGYPSIAIECEGAGCAVLAKPIQCPTPGLSQGCPEGTKCFNFDTEFEFYKADPIKELLFGDNVEFAPSSSLHAFIHKAAELWNGATLPSADNKFCFFSPTGTHLLDFAKNETITPWARDQATVNGDIVFLKDLVAWQDSGASSLFGMLMTPIILAISALLW